MEQTVKRWLAGDDNGHGGLQLESYKYVIIYFSATPRQPNG